MRNAIAHIGNFHEDLGALRRNPKRFLEAAYARYSKVFRPETVEGHTFGRMNDDGDYKIVMVDGIVLDRPIDLDIQSGRHTGYQDRGSRAGKVKGGGPQATEIDDERAANLLADIVTLNRKQKIPELLKSLKASVAANPPSAAGGSIAVPSRMATESSSAPPSVNALGEDYSDPVNAYHAEVDGLPATTEAERAVLVRIGQRIFRDRLLSLWERRCAVTGFALPEELLKASHAKPWASCEADADRLSPFNGLLLSPNMDAAFDRGFISVAETGEVLVSSLLSQAHRTVLGLVGGLAVKGLDGRHLPYLAWHREHVFRP